VINPVRARDQTGEADLDSGSARDSQSERAVYGVYVFHIHRPVFLQSHNNKNREAQYVLWRKYTHRETAAI
jgi:hypothetical protein